MTPEEKEKLKEAEKAHLRKLQELKQMARSATRTASVSKAMQEITSWSDKLGDTYNEMMEKIGLASATNEAKLDMALESEQSRMDELAAREVAEEEARKLRAQQLLQQMKAESAGTSPQVEKTLSGEKPVADRTDARPAENPPMPEKTIGRMK